MRDEVNDNRLRSLILGVDQTIPLQNGTYRTAIQFDNAATTPAFRSVMRQINQFAPCYSSVHRGGGYKSSISSNVYEQGRRDVQQFVHADRDQDVVIFTKSTTESINNLAFVLSEQRNPQNVVLLTAMEHAANDLPWRSKFNVIYTDVDRFGRLSVSDLEEKLVRYRGSVKLVSVTGASNVTGYINPIHQIAALAHRHGAKILVDGAQLVPHCAVDMKPFDSPEHIDYLVFSAHKMYAPFGTGVLIGPKETFRAGIPFLQGGGAIRLVTRERVDWQEPTNKDEAGTPNVMGVLALSAAIQTLREIGMDTIDKREKVLYRYAIGGMEKIPGLRFYSDPYREDTIGVIPFNLEGVPHGMMTEILSGEAGISVRNGFFCTHPYCQRLLGLGERDMDCYFANKEAEFPGLVRVSFGLYNTCSEIDTFLCVLRRISENKKCYIDKYSIDPSTQKPKGETGSHACTLFQGC